MDKPYHKSKGIWAGALLMAHAALQVYLNKGITPDAINSFLTGFGVVGIRDAIPAQRER